MAKDNSKVVESNGYADRSHKIGSANMVRRKNPNPKKGTPEYEEKRKKKEAEKVDAERAVIEKFKRGMSSLVALREEFLLPRNDDGTIDVNPEDNLAPAPFHYKWSDILLNDNRNFAIKGYRKSAKTQYILKAHPLYRLMFPTKERRYLLIVCRNLETAEKRLKDIIREYNSNQWCRHNHRKTIEESASVFQVEVIGADGKPIMIRLEAYGKQGSIRGASWDNLRPQEILADDLQNKDDMDSEKTLERDWDWFLDDFLPLGNRSTRIFMIANDLGEKCIINRVFNAEGNFDFACETVPRTTSLDDAGTPTWEAANTQEEIIAEYHRFTKEHKESIWMRNNMCVCVGDQDKVFFRDNFRYYTLSEMVNIASTCNIYIRADIAVGLKQANDYSAFVVMGVNPDNHWFIFDVPYGRYRASEKKKMVFELVRKWRPRNVGIEKAKEGMTLMQDLYDDMAKENCFFKLIELKPQGRKESRIIQALQPRFEAKTIHFPDKADWLPELEAELLMFTNQGTAGLHDDLIDALSYGVVGTNAPYNSAISNINSTQHRNTKARISCKAI